MVARPRLVCSTVPVRLKTGFNEGCRSRADLEDKMDWGRKGRVLVLEKI